VEAFVAQLANKFTTDAHQFPTEVYKLRYAFALLVGQARNRIALFIDLINVNRLTTVEGLFLMLKHFYGVTNKHEEALRKLSNLR
jgi:hypothetical protein